jgi:hypothetical protein
LELITADIVTEKGLYGVAVEVGFVEKAPIAVVVVVSAGVELPAETTAQPMVLKGLLDHHARFPAAGARDRITFVQKLFGHRVLLLTFPLV